MIRNRPVIVSFILFVSLFSVLLFLLFFIFFFLFCFVPHFFPCTLSCLTIFLLGLKSIGWPGKYGTRHRTQCRGAIKIHEAWKTRLAPDFAFVPADRNCVISHFTRFMRRVEYQNNWIPREFVIYKQPLNASESHQLLPPPPPDRSIIFPSWNLFLRRVQLILRFSHFQSRNRQKKKRICANSYGAMIGRFIRYLVEYHTID